MLTKLQDKDKIRALLKFYNTNQTEFATRLGFSQSALAHWITRNKIPFPVIHKIAQECKEIAFSWLVTGMGPMLLKDGGRTEEEVATFAFKLDINQPFIPGLAYDEVTLWQGIALEPSIHQGDYIALKNLSEDDHIDPEGTYLVTTSDGNQVLRHVAYIEEENVYELFADATSRVLKVKKQQVQKIQKVVFVGRTL